MDWKKYEKEIYDIFTQSYPDAKINYNQLVKGKYSLTDRQIDILIEGRIVGKKIKIVIDGKFYNKKIDVKHVESFISMVEDVDADQGILITSKGYTPAAINRAYYGPTKIELDILNFDELKQFQGPGGIPHSGSHGAIVSAPFGWVLDATRREWAVATLYQRGKTFEKAQLSGEFMYINIYSYNRRVKNMEDVLEFHEIFTLEAHPDATFEYSDTIERKDGYKTLMRKILRKETVLHEYSGFVDFNEFCVFCVLFTPKELEVKNIRKLEYCIERLLPINVNRDSVLETELKSLQELLQNADDQIEKAGILIRQGEILKTLERFDECETKFNESIKILSTSYGAIKGKLDLYLLTNRENDDLDEVIDDLFNLEPSKPTICQDIMEMFSEYDRINDVLDVFGRKIKDFSNNKEAKGNISYHLGYLYYILEQGHVAKNYFYAAKDCFTGILDSNHNVFSLIEENLKRIKS